MGWLPSEQVSHAFVLPLSLQGYPEPQEELPMPLCVLSKIPLPLSSPGSQHCGASTISQVTFHGHLMSPVHCSQSSA